MKQSCKVILDIFPCVFGKSSNKNKKTYINFNIEKFNFWHNLSKTFKKSTRWALGTQMWGPKDMEHPVKLSGCQFLGWKSITAYGLFKKFQNLLFLENSKKFWLFWPIFFKFLRILGEKYNFPTFRFQNSSLSSRRYKFFETCFVASMWL